MHKLSNQSVNEVKFTLFDKSQITLLYQMYV